MKCISVTYYLPNMVKYTWLIAFLMYITKIHAENPGPLVTATKGGVWPKPQHQNSTEKYFVYTPKNFSFKVTKTSPKCTLLYNALKRYGLILQDHANVIEQQLKFRPERKYKQKWLKDENYLGPITDLTVSITHECDDDGYPSINMDESYKLWITSERQQLVASSFWGILRGLESFSQLFYLADDGLSLRINSTIITDFPRYKHRGLLIDTSRHFIPLEKIYLSLDALSYNKMNVFHWHIVDDQSFPYVSVKFPELSEKGAYNPYSKVYGPADIQNVIEYARQRGIRVLPEFDTPGHTASWGLSHPELLTPCEIFNTFGPMDPSKNNTFTVLNELFSEIREVFKDEFIHLGGDEVDYGCWIQDQNITNFMQQLNISTYEGLESYYVQKVVNMVDKLQFKSMVWEEVFSNGVLLPNQTIVHVWKQDWLDTMQKVTSAGKYGLLSSCWYLDSLNSGGDWSNFYYCGISDFPGTPAQQKLILGGEACMWSEVVNEYNIISRVWPRASATAEQLWSTIADNFNLDEPTRRLEEHTCRMNRRGIGAQPPNGPGFCD